MAMRLLLFISALLTALTGVGVTACPTAAPAHQMMVAKPVVPARATQSVLAGQPVQALVSPHAVRVIARYFFTAIAINPIVVDSLRV